MGTSTPNRGPHRHDPLVPSWLDEPGNGANGDETSKPPLPMPAEGDRYRVARSNFSRFAGSGGSDQDALRRAVGNYVRTSIRGSDNAVRRIAPSRLAAGNVLDVLRGLQRDGMRATLRRLNIQLLLGRDVQDIFTGLTEVVCEDGGLIDDAIARDAWLETISRLDQFDIDNLDSLTEEQIRGLFLSFVSNSIKARLYQEIGVNGFKLSNDLDKIENFDEQFRYYIERSVRDSFSSDLSILSNMSDDDIKYVVDKTYLEAWELLQQLGDSNE